MMLPIFNYGECSPELALARPEFSQHQEIRASVCKIITEVRLNGDAALLEYAKKFDGRVPISLRISAEHVDIAFNSLEPLTLMALKTAINNVRLFHAAQFPEDLSIETSPGVLCERITRPIDAVGIYVPSGSAPLPSALIMSAIPAQLAGCKRRVLCTPANNQGEVSACILAAARLCEIDEIYAVGGAHAIAALAYGTQTIQKVDKIFGPGSVWVTTAKQMVAEDCYGAALDLPAGPSEVMVIADANAEASFVAADLLAQAEHDPLSQAILVTPSRILAEAVRTVALGQIDNLSRSSIIKKSLSNSRILVVNDLNKAFEVSNLYAPEHLILQIKNPRDWLKKVTSAGSIFLGQWSPETIGDYCSGTNHVLPTYGFARAYSGLSVLDFLKRITVQELTPSGLKILGPVATTLANLEGLDAHARAVQIRLESLEQTRVINNL